MCIFCLFLVYPKLSSSIVSFFVCVEVEGTSYLVADVAFKCYTGIWNSYLPAFIVGLLVYPIGIPLLFFFVLRRHLTRLHEVATKLQLGFLYEAYGHRLWFFEMVDMGHKLILTSLVGLLPVEFQMGTAISVTAIYAVVILLTKPLVQQTHDLLQLVVQAELLLLFLLGRVLAQPSTSLTPLADTMLSIVLIAGVVGTIVFFFSKVILLTRRRIQYLKRTKLEQYAEDSDDENIEFDGNPALSSDHEGEIIDQAMMMDEMDVQPSHDDR